VAAVPARSRNHRSLGLAVGELRLRAGLTQEELGFRSSTHRTYVGAIERGEKNLTWDKLLHLARGLEVEPAEIVHRAQAFGLD
jgi:transcriptional regulator with XRE-family HTH domain